MRKQSNPFALCTMLLCLLLFTPLLPLAAQTTPSPVLHRRSDPDPLDRPVFVKEGRRNSLLPDDLSGEYMLGKPGELIEITLQSGELNGYISRFGDDESDSGTPLTFFFERTAVHGRQMEFTTRQIHGVSYLFQGTIVRGPGRNPAEEGYYLLSGELIEHDSARQTEIRRTVNLKSGRQIG